MLIDDDPKRAAWVEKCLRDLGFDTCSIVANVFDVLKKISTHAPDVIIVDMESPGRDLLESLSVVAQHKPTPVVMFSTEEDPGYINKAVEAGVSTYLVGAIDPAKVKPIIEITFAQFRNFQKLRTELDQSRSELADRKNIDKAKLIVMHRLNVDENLAYKHLRKEAMNCGASIAVIAKRIIDSNARQ